MPKFRILHSISLYRVKIVIRQEKQLVKQHMYLNDALTDVDVLINWNRSLFSTHFKNEQKILSKELMYIAWSSKMYKYDVPVAGWLRTQKWEEKWWFWLTESGISGVVVTQGKWQNSLTWWFLGQMTQKHFNSIDKIIYKLSIFLTTYIKLAREILFFHWPLWKYLLLKCVCGVLKEIIPMIYLKRYREEMIDMVSYYTPIHQVSLLATGLILVVPILLQAVC